MSGTQTPSTETSRSEVVNTWGRVVVSIVVLFLFAAVSTLVLTHTIPSSESATMVVGAVLTMAGAVVSFWIGSSSGSVSKDAKLSAAPAALPGTTAVTVSPTTITTTTPAATATTTTTAPTATTTGTTTP